VYTRSACILLLVINIAVLNEPTRSLVTVMSSMCTKINIKYTVNVLAKCFHGEIHDKATRQQRPGFEVTMFKIHDLIEKLIQGIAECCLLESVVFSSWSANLMFRQALLHVYIE